MISSQALSQSLCLPTPIYAWLQQLNLIQPQQQQPQSRLGKILLYDDQIYMENGYLIGKLLKRILKEHLQEHSALLKIRKIAFLSSNQNWQIIKQVLIMISYDQPIDCHNVPHSLISNILLFLYDNFAVDKPLKPKDKPLPLHLDSSNFIISKPYSQANNLLQLIVLLIHNSFHQLPLSQCLGLLIDKGKYLKSIIKYGSIDRQFTFVMSFYEQLSQNCGQVSLRIEKQSENCCTFYDLLSYGVMSESRAVADATCSFFKLLVSFGGHFVNWIDKQKGYMSLMRSEHQSVLTYLMGLMRGKFEVVFNQNLNQQFRNKLQNLQIFIKIVKYLHQNALYSKEVFEKLSLEYFLNCALDIFDVDEISKHKLLIRKRAKQLIAVMVICFWHKIHHTLKSKIFYAFELIFCKSEEEKLHSLINLFEMISSQLGHEQDGVMSFFKVMSKYWNNSHSEIKMFITLNLEQVYSNSKQHFPLGFFIINYQISTIAQFCDYSALFLLARNQMLLEDQVTSLLRICSVYYYQQIHCECFLQIIAKIIQKNVNAKTWGKEMLSELLSKWTLIQLPSMSKLTANMQAKQHSIRLLSIGIKKKQMMKFHELNKVKDVLRNIAEINDFAFLKEYQNILAKTIAKVEKEKKKETRESKNFLMKLLNEILNKLQIKAKVNERPSFYDQAQSKDNHQRVHQQQNNNFQERKVKQQIEFESRKNQLMVDLLKERAKQDLNRNEFMESLRSEQIGKILSQQVNHPERLQFPLLPFSEDESLTNSIPYFLKESLLEQYEISYLKLIKKQYEVMLNDIAVVYRASHHVAEFIDNLAIQQYFNQEDIQQLTNIQQKNSFDKSDLEESAETCFEILFHAAFLVFKFMSNKRIIITCVGSFFEVLNDKLQAIKHTLTTTTNHHFKASESRLISPLIINPNNEKQIIHQNMNFTYTLQTKLLKYNSLINPYLICFMTINDIIKKALGIQLPQPISQIQNHIPENVSQKMEASYLSQKQYELNQKEAEELEDIIEKQDLLIKSSRVNNEVNVTMNQNMRIGNKFAESSNKIKNIMRIKAISMKAQNEKEEQSKNQKYLDKYMKEDEIKKASALKEKIRKRREALEEKSLKG